MADIDALFKRPNLPSKRKFEPALDPNAIYKSTKTSPNGDVKGALHASVTDNDGEEDAEDGVAGPSLPPDDDEEAGVQDEEGRFFGGGINRNTVEVLDFIDEQDKDEYTPEKIDLAWLRRLALNFEKRISKNAELRAKFEDDPQKFMASEADLDTDVKALSVLTNHPELYGEFAKLGCVGSLVSLLAHENTDIAIAAIEIIDELTDEDVEAEQAQWDSLADALLEADLPDLIVQNLDRLKESDESDRAGIYHSLGILENLASQPAIAEKIAESSQILKWLLARVQKRESPVSQNKQYSAEILAILLQSSSKNRTSVTTLDAVDTFLQILSAYRNRDPAKESDEEEFIENIFDCLTCLVDDLEGKRKFVEAEGVELCLIMLREGTFSKPRALRLLDHALGGSGAGEVCEKFVEAAGLKVLFTMFMKSIDHQSTEHILGLFASLLRHLPGESAPRIRTLAKFMEKNYEKLSKLVKLRQDYSARLKPVEDQIQKERDDVSLDEMELAADEWLSRRLDAGLFCLQTIDLVLAWLAAEDAGARSAIVKSLSATDQGLADVATTLREQLSMMDKASTAEDNTEAEMLNTLISFL